MRRPIVTFALVVCASIVATTAAARQDDYGSRSTEFCSTRKPAARPPSTAPRTRPATPRRPGAPLGLGYTLFARSQSGSPVRVDPRRQFKDGDAIRVVLESNVDGYLYIFNSDERNQNPVMIYPQVRLNGGDNFVEAHVPTEVPSRREPEPANRWLVLAGGPTTDRLLFVVSAEPLPGVPTGAELAEWCKDNRDCYWSPTARAWGALALASNRAARVAASRDFGQEMSREESDAIEGRGAGLASAAPPPAVIAFGSSPSARTLVAVVDIAHGAP